MTKHPSSQTLSQPELSQLTETYLSAIFPHFNCRKEAMKALKISYDNKPLVTFDKAFMKGNGENDIPSLITVKMPDGDTKYFKPVHAATDQSEILKGSAWCETNQEGKIISTTLRIGFPGNTFRGPDIATAQRITDGELSQRLPKVIPFVNQALNNVAAHEGIVIDSVISAGHSFATDTSLAMAHLKQLGIESKAILFDPYGVGIVAEKLQPELLPSLGYHNVSAADIEHNITTIRPVRPDNNTTEKYTDFFRIKINGHENKPTAIGQHCEMTMEPLALTPGLRNHQLFRMANAAFKAAKEQQNCLQHVPAPAIPAQSRVSKLLRAFVSSKKTNADLVPADRIIEEIAQSPAKIPLDADYTKKIETAADLEPLLKQAFTAHNFLPASSGILKEMAKDLYGYMNEHTLTHLSLGATKQAITTTIAAQAHIMELALSIKPETPSNIKHAQQAPALAMSPLLKKLSEGVSILCQGVTPPKSSSPQKPSTTPAIHTAQQAARGGV